MKRFVVIMWDLNSITNVRLLADEQGFTKIFPRRKEARDYVQQMNSETGFAYRTTSIHK